MITKIHKHDTMAVVKITNWKSSEILEQLKQNSVVSGDHFIREVRFGSNLMQQLEGLEGEGKLELEVVTTYCSPSERIKQLSDDSTEQGGVLSLTQEQIRELVRQAYMSGGEDSDHDMFQWCKQGSKERAEEILEEFLQEIEND